MDTKNHAYCWQMPLFENEAPEGTQDYDQNYQARSIIEI